MSKNSGLPGKRETRDNTTRKKVRDIYVRLVPRLNEGEILINGINIDNINTKEIKKYNASRQWPAETEESGGGLCYVPSGCDPDHAWANRASG